VTGYESILALMASFIRFSNRNKHLSVFLILLLFPRDISQHGKINANNRLLLNDGKSEKFIWNIEFEVSAPTAVSEPSYSYGQFHYINAILESKT
jgi:hypothetical protein